MTQSEIHEEFLRALNELIFRFNHRHPDLFVKDIEIHKQEFLKGQWAFLGATAEIIVQPEPWKSETLAGMKTRIEGEPQ